MGFFTFHDKVKNRSAGSASSAAEPQREILTVGQLTARIDTALRDGLPTSLTVRGEASNFRNHSASGHCYFTLKDHDACIKCVMFKSDSARLKFTPQDGMELLATGRVGVYGPQGQYQLYVSRLEPLGQGALELAFRQMHAGLQAEGLFAPERKHPIPAYPQRIVLVTSRETAALQDMLKVLRRFPWLNIAICHVPVQGDGAAERIAKALGDLNRCADTLGGIDLILLGRGGGSLEDLWAFNEEVVARAIAASRIPIITGVGHEIDISIADLVSDHHAHTPTEAAQVATMHWRAARDILQTAAVRLRREMGARLEQARQRLGQVQRHDAFRRPLDRINLRRQHLDDRQRALTLATATRLRRLHGMLRQLESRLDQCRPTFIIARMRSVLVDVQRRLMHAMNLRLRCSSHRLGRTVAALGMRHPGHVLRLSCQRLDALAGRWEFATQQALRQRQCQLDALEARLRALGPQQVLQRGYSITLLKKGKTAIRRVADVRPGDRLITRLADGSIESVVEDSAQLRLFE